MAPEGTPAPGGDSSAPSSASPSPAGSPSTTTVSVPSTPALSATPPEPKWEDHPRTKGLLAETQKERRARQDFERKVAEYDTQLAEERRKVAALTNTKIPTADEQDEQAVRDRFAQLYPHLSGLTPDDIEALRAWRTQEPQRQQAETHYWTSHGKKMLGEVYKKIGAELGDLTPRQKQKINTLYINAAISDPAILARHDAGDETLLDEFVKDYLEDTAEPARRSQVARDLSRTRAVPSGGNRSIPSSDGKPIDVTNDKAVMDFLVENRKGQFTGRR